MPLTKEVVEVKVELPKDVYEALDWYVQRTGYWVCNDDRDKSISEWIAHEVRGALEAEANSGASQAAEFAASELKLLLDIE